MNQVFEKNLLYLKEKQPEIYKEVRNYTEDKIAQSVSFSLANNRNNTFNIQCVRDQDEFMLYSKYDPNYECKRWLQSYEFAENVEQDFVVYGLGLAYHLEEITKHYPSVKLFIFEPEVGIFVEALKVIDVEQLFTHKSIVKLSVGKATHTLNQYANYLYHYGRFPLRILDIPIYRSIDIEFFFNFLKLLEKLNINKLFKTGFYSFFGDQMFRNTIRNLSKMYKTPSIDLLKDKFSNCTAMVVGGGPSLQYDIPYIKEHRNKLLIIAAGSSVQSLVHMGVEPHLIISMDPGIHNSYIFTKNDFSDIPLLFMPQVHYQSLEAHSKNNFFAYYNNDPIINKFINVESKNYTFTPTYSVTGTAIQVAIYLGAKNVILTGQDLSYPGKQVYSPGAIHVDYNTKTDKDLTIEVPNVKGGKNPTTFSMKKTLENIEQTIESNNKVIFINSSSLGAIIKGTEYVPLKTAIKTYTGNVYDFNVIKNIVSEVMVEEHPDFVNLVEQINQILNAFLEFRKSCSIVTKDLDRLIKYSTKNIVKAEKILRSIEEEWKQVVRHNVFRDIIEEWMVLEMNEYDQKILDVYNETNIEKKSLLLKEVLGNFCVTMLNKISDIENEFKGLLYEIER